MKPAETRARDQQPNSWYCTVDGTRLSYGIYCRTCKTECYLAWRPPEDLARLRREMEAFPPPSFPKIPEGS